MDFKKIFAYLVTGVVLMGAAVQLDVGALLTNGVGFFLGASGLVAIAVFLVGLAYFLSGLLVLVAGVLDAVEKVRHPRKH